MARNKKLRNSLRPDALSGNIYDAAINNEVLDRPLPGGGAQYQAPGSNLDPTGFGWYASQLWDTPEMFGGGGNMEGWTPPWGGNMNSFNEWFGEEYDAWSTGGDFGILSGLGNVYDGYFASLSGGDVPSYADWMNYEQGIIPGQGSNYMQPGGTGGNIGGAGDLTGGSIFSGLGYGNYGPGFGGFAQPEDCEPAFDMFGQCVFCCD